MTKKELRDKIRQMRREVEAEDASYASELLADLIFEIPDDNLSDLEGKTVGLYKAFDGEIDVSLLAEKVSSRGARTAFPAVAKDKIVFRQAGIDADEMFEEGAYGIKQPKEGLAEVVPDIIIVPGVAYNEEGIRLGMGGGYYDRYYRENPDAVYVGVCYDFQVTSDLPFDDGDMACDILIPIDTRYDEDEDEGEDEL
ncbi:MAG: 5-formyltetrahydrofolate cyclo-ligase [Clostridiales bacterium]|nr:5-formyltetrahydrofolate cyclo-ligase [Clostridiales bacterium]